MAAGTFYQVHEKFQMDNTKFEFKKVILNKKADEMAQDKIIINKAKSLARILKIQDLFNNHFSELSKFIDEELQAPSTQANSKKSNSSLLVQLRTIVEALTVLLRSCRQDLESLVLENILKYRILINNSVRAVNLN